MESTGMRLERRTHGWDAPGVLQQLVWSKSSSPHCSLLLCLCWIPGGWRCLLCHNARIILQGAPGKTPHPELLAQNAPVTSEVLANPREMSSWREKNWPQKHLEGPFNVSCGASRAGLRAAFPWNSGPAPCPRNERGKRSQPGPASCRSTPVNTSWQTKTKNRLYWVLPEG